MRQYRFYNAAILGLDDNKVIDICKGLEFDIFVANYNCPGQIVISGETNNIKKACEIFKNEGAKRTVILEVNGAFHSPLMQSAKDDMEYIIRKTEFKQPICPVYQNVDATATVDKEKIKDNLVSQITSSVNWSQTIRNMIADGATVFVGVGNGNVLKGLVKKINSNMETKSALDID